MTIRSDHKAAMSEIESLWASDRRSEAAANAGELYKIASANDAVARFYISFCANRLKDRELGLLAARESFERHRSAEIFYALCQNLLLTGRDGELSTLAERHLEDASIAGAAHLQYGAALLRRTCDIDRSVEYFHRGAGLPGALRSADAASQILPSHAFGELADLREPTAQIDFVLPSPQQPEGEFVVCATGDEPYFRSFFDLYCESFFAHDDNPRHLVHFHVFDPSDALLEEAGAIARSRWGTRLQISYERTGRQRSYYYVGRFILIPSLLSRYGCPVAVTDIDCVFRRDLDKLIDATAQADLGIVEANRFCYPWENTRAGMVVFRPTPAGMRYAHAVRNFIARIPETRIRSYWYLDQLALYQCANEARTLHSGKVVNIIKVHGQTCRQLSGRSGHPDIKAERAKVELARMAKP